MATTVESHRTQVQVASGLNLLAGIWLFVSAFAVYAHGPMVTNNVICGIAVVVLAAIRAFGAYDQGWVSWLNALIGVWVVVSPWAVMGAPGPAGPTYGMIINNCITGGVVIVLGIWSALATNTAPGTTGPEGTVRPS
jgi:hypothetical protein